MPWRSRLRLFMAHATHRLDETIEAPYDRNSGGAEEIIRGEDRILTGDGHIVISDRRPSCEVQQVCERLVRSGHSSASCLLLSPRYWSKMPPVPADGPKEFPIEQGLCISAHHAVRCRPQSGASIRYKVGPIGGCLLW